MFTAFLIKMFVLIPLRKQTLALTYLVTIWDQCPYHALCDITNRVISPACFCLRRDFHESGSNENKLLYFPQASLAG